MLLTLFAITKGNKDNQTNPVWFIPLIIFTMVSVLPTNALAFEHTLPVSSAATFEIPVLDVSPTSDTALVLNAVPSYDAIEAGTVYGGFAPVTIKGNWPAHTPSYSPRQTTRLATALAQPVVMVGEASYYSRAGCLGCNPRFIMANGQPLNDNALTMAIGADKKHLVGRSAKVTNVVTGQSVEVRITDTGGFYKAKYGNRVADLTIATKQAIGIKGGLGQVKVEVF